MKVTLDLKPEVEARVSQRAEKEGTTVSEYLERIIEDMFQPQKSSDEAQREKKQAALAMLRQWDEEDKTDNPEKIARQESEWEGVKLALDESHISNRILFLERI